MHLYVCTLEELQYRGYQILHKKEDGSCFELSELGLTQIAEIAKIGTGHGSKNSSCSATIDSIDFGLQ